MTTRTRTYHGATGLSTEYACGCIAEQSRDRILIHYCPTHAAAPEMRALLERGAQITEDTHPGFAKAARALLAKIDHA